MADTDKTQLTATVVTTSTSNPISEVASPSLAELAREQQELTDHIIRTTEEQLDTTRAQYEHYRRIFNIPVPVAVDNQFIPAEAQRSRTGAISSTSGIVQTTNDPRNTVDVAVSAIRKFMNLPTELQGFLVEMCKHPIERDTILIFKDWLQQHGEYSLALLTEEDVQKEREACVAIVDNTEVPYEVPYSSAGDITPEILKVLHDITKRIRARGNKGAKS